MSSNTNFSERTFFMFKMTSKKTSTESKPGLSYAVKKLKLT